MGQLWSLVEDMNWAAKSLLTVDGLVGLVEHIMNNPLLMVMIILGAKTAFSVRSQLTVPKEVRFVVFSFDHIIIHIFHFQPLNTGQDADDNLNSRVDRSAQRGQRCQQESSRCVLQAMVAQLQVGNESLS